MECDSILALRALPHRARSNFPPNYQPANSAAIGYTFAECSAVWKALKFNPNRTGKHHEKDFRTDRGM
jgi:hypothetical protein